MKLKGFCIENEMVIRLRRQPTEREKTFSSYTLFGDTEFELRASHLLTRSFTTRVTTPALIFVLDIFEIGSHEVFTQDYLHITIFLISVS
jgi:hypothetical protein